MTRAQVRIAFLEVVSVPPRLADMEVLEWMAGGMGGPTEEEVAEYLWDHYMGEPEFPTLEEITLRVKKAVAEKCPECGQPDNCGDCDHTPPEAA